MLTSTPVQDIYAQQQADAPEWVLTFSDEFDGDAVDTDRWEVLTRKDNFNGEEQYYLPEHASIVDGMLRITTTKEPYDGKAYRSARLESWFSQTHGRFEARAKIPTTQGIWPAFWLLPRDVKWPLGGEIDIMEHGGSKPERLVFAYHYADEAGEHQFASAEHSAKQDTGEPVRFPDGFHVYAVEWAPTEIVFYVDGVECYRLGQDQVPVSDTPMSIVLNTAVGGWFDGEPDETTVFPQYFDIDYVRAYRRADGDTGSDSDAASTPDQSESTE
jgi:beta-glucanase (GH16 family)